MLPEHCFDALAVLAVDAPVPLRPEFPRHGFFQPVPLEDPLLGVLSVASVLNCGDEQFVLSSTNYVFALLQ